MPANDLTDSDRELIITALTNNIRELREASKVAANDRIRQMFDESAQSYQRVLDKIDPADEEPHAKPVAASEQPRQCKLSEALEHCFRCARVAAEEAGAASDEDGGTCNLDSPAFRLPRVPEKVIVAAAEAAGCRASEFTWFGGKRWYWLNGFTRGQGNLRSRMSRAATKALEAAAKGLLDQMQVCEYCQMD